MSRAFSPRALLLLSLALAGCPTEPMGDAGPGNDVPGADVPGGGGDTPMRDAPVPDTVPVFRNEVTTPDAELAQAVLELMGSPDAGSTRTLCNECHDLTRAQIRYWSTLTIASLERCIPDPTLAGGDADAAAVVTCIRGAATNRYNPDDLGVFATAGDLDWFRYVFAHGAGADWTGEYARFVDQAAMPRGGHTPFTQAEFDMVAEWFLRGVPGVDDILPAETRPTECTPTATPDIVAYVAERQAESWATTNAAAGMLMYGCAGASSARDCLADETLASTTTFGANWDNVTVRGVAGARNRILYELPYRSAYWTRSSADGRWVSNGAASAPNLRFVDLASGTGPGTGRVIGGNADYDPFFFPDDSGFLVHGGSGPRVCRMSVLTTGMPTMLNFTEAGCAGGGAINLYQHLGAALSGGDYWAIDSVGAGMYATYDTGEPAIRRNPSTSNYSASARSTIRFLTNGGSTFTVGSSARINHPFEGDAVISPSLGLLSTRLAGPSGQLAFRVRRLSVSGTGTMRTISTTPVGEYCITGGKPGFSYDERFLVLHHYIENTDADAEDLGFTSAADPRFAPYRMRGGANVYMIELATGNIYRITNMAPGSFALFPHFRSDGWIYYLARSDRDFNEQIVANDAALLLP